MKIFNPNIIKTAMLGTNIKKVETGIFPDVVQEHLNLEKEGSELFLDGMSLTFGYMTGGDVLTKISGISDSIQQCPDEVLPYCNNRIVSALTLILKENRYALPTFLPLLIKLVNRREEIFPPEFITKFNPLISGSKSPLRKYKLEAIQSLGERGKWIFSLKKKETGIRVEKAILDLSKAERKKHFLGLLQTGDNQEVITFLEEVFQAETVASKKNYLSIIAPYLSEKKQPILDYMDAIIKTDTAKSEAHQALAKYVDLLQISMPNSEHFSSFFEGVFSQIWKQKKGVLAKLGVKPKTDKELLEILSPLEKFPITDFLFAVCHGEYAEQTTGLYGDLTAGSVTEFLYFSFVIVPMENWCSLLDISKQKLVKLIHAIKISSESKSKKASFVEALVLNARRHRDVELARELYKLLGFGGAGFNFLTLLPKEEAFKILAQNPQSLKNAGIDIMDFVIEHLGITEGWNENFTKVAIQSCLEKYVNNRHQLRLALWRGAPFFHKKTHYFIPTLIDQSSHSRNLQDDFDEIFTIKSAFDNIKN